MYACNVSGISHSFPQLEQSVQPETEAEKKTAPPTSGSPLVKIKDEPVDEEYEKAFGPQAPARKIKDEPDTSEVSSDSSVTR